jgi:plastocyanin
LLALLSAGCVANRPREVVIVARGMTFALPADPETPNPSIRVYAGERLQVTLRNESPGLMHDFQIPAWDVQSDQIRGGRSSSVTFTVPADEGHVTYLCGPHASMMHGVVEVAAR